MKRLLGFSLLRPLGLALLSAFWLAASAAPASAQHRPKKHKNVTVHKRVHVDVDVHHRGGFWRGVAVGSTVASLPHGHARVVVGGAPFFHHGGVYYRHTRHGYVVVAPPMGAVIAAVPPGCAAVGFGGVGYHYCGGTYYAPAPGGFAVVAAPIGITVDELPIGCTETVTLDGVEHYSCDGFHYRPVVRDGATFYVTVKR